MMQNKYVISKIMPHKVKGDSMHQPALFINAYLTIAISHSRSLPWPTFFERAYPYPLPKSQHMIGMIGKTTGF